MSDIPSIFVPANIQPPVPLPSYPTAGIPVVQGSQTSNSTNANYLRVNSFSVALLPNNTAIIAVASQDSSVISNNLITDSSIYGEIELARRESSRVFVSGTLFDTAQYSPSNVRSAKVVSTDSVLQTITIEVDDFIYSLTDYQVIFSISGMMAGQQLQVESLGSPNQLICKFYNNANPNGAYVEMPVGLLFNYICYTDGAPTPYNPTFTPLPYIESNGFAIPAVNPQIATNAAIFPSPDSSYVYIVCQSPVNGTYQLFFYAMQVGTDRISLWKQITFNGENKNPRIKVDSIGNLHVTWESNRCGAKNGFGIYYGVLGTSSRPLINESFISALDKQTNLLTDNTVTFTTPIVAIFNPVAIDLRQENEYGYYGPMWQTYTSGPATANVIDSGTITLSGNPSQNEFIACGLLTRDQSNIPFDGNFSQLSYQISFKINVSTGSSVLTDYDIQTNYNAFKSQFSPVKGGSSGVNIYSKSGKNYTISRFTKFDGGMIPICSAYELSGFAPNTNSNLKHFMLCAIPEKVSFEATNIANNTDIISQVLYTGNYKLTLILSTSVNMSDESADAQKYHIIRDFGSFSTGKQYDFKIAIHYAHLHTETIDQRVANNTIQGTLQNSTFTGNIIIAVNNVVQLAENFTPGLSDTFYGFNIALGVPQGGQYPLNLTSAFNQNLFENESITLYYSSIAVGPHTILADPSLTHMAKFDRNVSRMVIKNTIGETSSRTGYDEAFLSQTNYDLDLGLSQEKITFSQIPLTFNGRCTSPSITIDTCDIVHITYQSNRTGNWQIYYMGSADAGMPFRFDTTITNTQSNAFNPSIAVDQNGRRLIAWHDDRNGDFQIYAARSNRSITCRDGQAMIQEVLDFATDMYDPYDPYDPYESDICSVQFTFTNETSQTSYFDFSLLFYADSELNILKTNVCSQNNITGWGANGLQFPYGGIQLAPGSSVNITYQPSKNDDVSGMVYYVHTESITSSEITRLPYVYAYYCPIKQSAKCTIPCVYSNSTNATENVHFRVSFYADSAYSILVMSADSSIDQRRWISSSLQFPIAGVSVPKMDTSSVLYVPNILTPDIYRNQPVADSLLCGAIYHVKVESFISGICTQIDTFSFECPCSWINTQIGKIDKDSKTWICSGQGKDDTRITNSTNNAMFASTAASADGTVYITWEDYRVLDALKKYSPDIFFAVWNSNTDVFYSSAQGSYDQRVTYSISPKTRYYKPLVIVGNFQNPTFFYNTNSDVFQTNTTLYKLVAPNVKIADYPVGSGVFTAGIDIPITTEDVSTCLNICVDKKDVIDQYHVDSDTPIPLVSKCLINLNLSGPSGTYAVRLRNESDSKWSDWLSILPGLPAYPPINTYNLRGDGTMRSAFEAIFIGGDKFTIPWVLSAGSGNKTVYAEILTQMGKTPQMSLNILARYDEMKYKIELFSTSDFQTSIPQFNGVPVASTQMLTTGVVNENDVSSITQVLMTISTIYVKVTFADPIGLQNILNLANIQKFANLFSPSTAPSLSFNVIQQGINAQYGLSLTSVGNGVYTGSFSIQNSDGIYNKDGVAAVVVNIPDPAFKVFIPDFTVDNLDIYNVNLPVLGDFEGQYSLVPQETPADIKTRQRNQIAARNISLEEFKQKYNKTAFCTSMSDACVSTPDTAVLYDDEVTMPPTYTGPLTCTSFNWTAYNAKEPFYYLDNSNISLNSVSPVWVQHSPPFYIDLSDPRTLSLGFGSASECSGVLFMIPEDTVVTFSGGTSTSADPVIFTIPTNSIVISNTSGFFCGDQTALRNATRNKTFNMLASTAVIPAGNPGNNGTIGTNDVFGIGWYITTFASGIPMEILESYGFLNSQGILSARFAFIISGIGHCYIRGCSCDANCY